MKKDTSSILVASNESISFIVVHNMNITIEIVFLELISMDGVCLVDTGNRSITFNNSRVSSTGGGTRSSTSSYSSMILIETLIMS